MSNPRELTPTKHVLILGGGTAWWMTAAYLVQRLRLVQASPSRRSRSSTSRAGMKQPSEPLEIPSMSPS